MIKKIINKEIILLTKMIKNLKKVSVRKKVVKKIAKKVSHQQN